MDNNDSIYTNSQDASYNDPEFSSEDIDVLEGSGGEQGLEGAEFGDYDFSDIVPEGSEFDYSKAEEFSNIARKMNLSGEQAKELAKYGMEYAQEMVGNQNEVFLNKVDGWGQDARRELGGRYDKELSVAASGVEFLEKQIPELRQALNETGFGNRVEAIKAFSMIGRLMREDSFKGVYGGKPSRKSIYNKTDFSSY